MNTIGARSEPRQAEAPGLKRWIGYGMFGLPLFGALTFWSSLDPQPDPTTHYEAWAQYVTTDYYVLTHVLGSGLGLVLAIFGTFALAAFLTRSRSWQLGLSSMVLTVLGYALFLMLMGVSAFASPFEGQAYLAGIRGLPELPDSSADLAMAIVAILVLALNFLGNVMLGIAIWRSAVLPKCAGALWAAAPVLMYPLGIAYAMTLGAKSTPPTVPLGALLIVFSGTWMVWWVLQSSNSAGTSNISSPLKATS